MIIHVWVMGIFNGWNMLTVSMGFIIHMWVSSMGETCTQCRWAIIIFMCGYLQCVKHTHSVDWLHYLCVGIFNMQNMFTVSMGLIFSARNFWYVHYYYNVIIHYYCIIIIIQLYRVIEYYYQIESAVQGREKVWTLAIRRPQPYTTNPWKEETDKIVGDKK